MDALDLMAGIAVIIDDEIGKENANINEIVQQIADKNMPYLTHQNIPDDELIKHFRGISFILLDWKLLALEEELTMAGVDMPGGLNKKNNIDFIRKLRDECFCPLFIFTNEPIDAIKVGLEEEGLYSNDKPCHIFIKSKADLIKGDTLFKEIDDWLRNNISIYVLKEWEKEYRKSINTLFSEFQELNPAWPCLMWSCFAEDHPNQSFQSYELGELILANLRTRMAPFTFENDLLSGDITTIPPEETRKIIESSMILKEPKPGANTGDIYKKYNEQSGTTKYLLNIRPQCDLLRSTNPDSYFLQGKEITLRKAKEEYFNEGLGAFIDKASSAIVAFIDDGKVVEFQFYELIIKKQSKLEEEGFEKIGCMLHPHVTKIQKRYTYYLQRQGLPRIPKDLLNDVDPEPNDETLLGTVLFTPHN